MGLRVPFVSNPFGALSPNKVVKTNKTNNAPSPAKLEEVNVNVWLRLTLWEVFVTSEH